MQLSTVNHKSVTKTNLYVYIYIFQVQTTKYLDRQPEIVS